MRRLLVAGLVLGSLLLAAPARGTTASCSVSPSSVPRGGDYTISFTGGPANTVVAVWTDYTGGLKDEQGQITDASGNLTTPAQAFTQDSVVGPAKVVVERNDGPGHQKLAQCSFTVI